MRIVMMEALYVNGNNGNTSYNATCFDSFAVEQIPKEIENLIKNKNIIRNIYRIQAFHSIMCGYFSIRFFDFVQKGTTLLDSTNFLSLNKYKKND